MRRKNDCATSLCVCPSPCVSPRHRSRLGLLVRRVRQWRQPLPGRHPLQRRRVFRQADVDPRDAPRVEPLRPVPYEQLVVLAHVVHDHKLPPHQPAALSRLVRRVLLVRGAEEPVGGSHVHPLVWPGVVHELHLAPLLVRGRVDDPAVGAEGHGVVAALLIFGVPPPLARAPEDRLVSLGNVEVCDEAQAREGMGYLAEGAVALLPVSPAERERAVGILTFAARTSGLGRGDAEFLGQRVLPAA
mmetsp:Transcript_14460/g.57028  ORF Transcript_14460/g.57028 Transcript_14460/m.57028 type:complete len:244 (-) Transcript_14460:101-832(-)